MWNRLAILALAGCGSTPRFPLREPLRTDTDLRSVYVRCHAGACAPTVYESPLYWDAADNSVFRPIADVLSVHTASEAVNVNSLDEVPDSSWFRNRIASVTPALLADGACTPAQRLDPDAPEGAWLIDKGRGTGSTPGFRIRVGKAKYYVKLETATDQPDRQSAAAVIGAAVLHAAGYNATCEQLLYVRPSVFRLKPGLVVKSYFAAPEPYDQAALDRDLAAATRRDGRIRVSVSAWVPGHIIGPFRFSGTREDDPNDVIAHEDRRELRGMRLLAAWIERHDSREANSLDTWLSDAQDRPDASPGHVVHYQLDTSDALGARWGWETIDRRMSKSYLLDWGDVVADLVTLGIPQRPWDRAHLTPGHEMFGYFNVRDFAPEQWKPEYPNAAFSRMTEHDGAWMARILAHFTPAHIETLARMADLTDPAQTRYLAEVLQGRLHRILVRYLTRLSPLDDVHVEGTSLCAVDLAEARGVRPATSFRYTAGGARAVRREAGGRVCVELAHVAGDGGAADDAASRYVRVELRDGVAQGPLVAHLYDLGPSRGFVLVGVERR